MGVYIYLSISKSVTKDEWGKAYEKTLKLVEAFPLVEIRKTKVQGMPLLCLVKSREQWNSYGWNQEHKWQGWRVAGDSVTLRTAETYSLPRNLVEEKQFDKEAGDAAFTEACSMLFREKESGKVYHLWGAKTQGEPYHIYLLAIACLLEACLGSKAYVSGDITPGQCRKASRLASTYLPEPVPVLDSCDMKRWYTRIQRWPISDVKKLHAFEAMYLGEKGAAFGAFLRQNFPEEVCREYWKARFQKSPPDTYNFAKVVQEYLAWGFDLQELCDLISFDDHGETPSAYEKLINAVLDTGVYRPDQKSNVCAPIDLDAEEPYGIEAVFAQIFAGDHTKEVDRYIPMDQIRAQLAAGMRGRCDVDGLIEKYQQKTVHNGSSRAENEVQRIIREEMENRQEDIERYDITQSKELPWYHAGDRIHPRVLQLLKTLRWHYETLAKEDLFAELMKHPAGDRCRWLANNNRNVEMRDVDWEKIFTDIKSTPGSFARYYPMARLQLNAYELAVVVRSLMLNDALYAFFQSLAPECEQ